jgi:predicted nucleic acid-binding protein
MQIDGLTPAEIRGNPSSSAWAMGLSRVRQVDRESSLHIALKEGQGSFADAIIAALGGGAGCSRTLTFDRKALRLPSFEHP